MENNNKLSVSLWVVVIIAIVFLLLVLGIVAIFVFGNNFNKNTNTEPAINTEKQSVVKENEINTSTPDVKSSSESNSSPVDITASTETTNVKSSSASNPITIGEWGLASKYISGEYIDIPTRITKITRGTEAAKEYENYCNNKSTIYKYEDAKEDMEWTIIEYEIDLTKCSSNTRANLDAKLKGADGSNSIKYNNKIYLSSTVNISSDSTCGEIITAKFATQLPIGCSDYLITLGSSSSTQAFIKGK